MREKKAILLTILLCAVGTVTVPLPKSKGGTRTTFRDFTFAVWLLAMPWYEWEGEGGGQELLQ